MGGLHDLQDCYQSIKNLVNKRKYTVVYTTNRKMRSAIKLRNVFTFSTACRQRRCYGTTDFSVRDDSVTLTEPGNFSNSWWPEPSCGATTKKTPVTFHPLDAGRGWCRWRQRNNTLNLLCEYLCTCGGVCVCLPVFVCVCVWRYSKSPNSAAPAVCPSLEKRNGWVPSERETRREGWGGGGR